MQKRLANFQGGEEDMKVSGSLADSGGYHIPSKLGSDLSPEKCKRLRYFLPFTIVAYGKN